MQKMPRLLFALILLVTSIPGRGAVPSTAPTTAAVMPATNPVVGTERPPIEFGDVAVQSESLSLRLRQIRAGLSSDRTTQAIDEELPMLSNEIDSRLEETSRLLGAAPSLQVLPTLEADWQAIDKNLRNWKHALTQRANQLTGQNDSLSATQKAWEETLEFADKKNANVALRQHIQATILTIPSAQDDIKTTRSHVWAINRDLDEKDARVLDVLASIKEAREQAFSRLFTKDSPAIWTMASHWPAGLNPIQDSANSFFTQMAGLRAYASREKLAFVLHAFIFILLAAGLYWARRGVQRTVEKDPTLAGATLAFESPLITSIVLCLLVSVWIYPQAPRLLWAIVGAAALIPTVIILRRLVERRLFAILNAMVVFYFLDQLRTVVESQQIVSRILFLLEMLAGVLFLASFIAKTRSPSATRKLSDLVWKTIQVAVRVVLVILSIAFLANALGYVSFANLIGDATLDSAYLAVTLYATTRIADGLLSIALRSWPASLLAIVRLHEPLIRSHLRRLILWAALIVWFIATLEMLSLRVAVSNAIHNILDAQLIFGSLHLSLRHVLRFAITIWAAFFASRLLRFILEEDVYARFPLASGISYAISKILHYVILVVGFVVAIAALGYDMTSFTILVGAFGVGLGFGLQNIINNFVSGLILLFERPIKVGDQIQMDDANGVVQHIGIRATILRTTDSSEIIVPNGNILSSKVTNWTLSNHQRGIEIPVGVAAGNDPKHIIELLKSVAAAHPLITDNPPPQAFFEKFNGDSFNFRLRAWTNRAEAWVGISSDLAVAINSAFVKENIILK